MDSGIACQLREYACRARRANDYAGMAGERRLARYSEAELKETLNLEN